MEPLTDRFWRKVNVVRDATSCWNWVGGPFGEGLYGIIGVNGSSIRTHRVSWEIHFGKIPDGECVLHECDNKKCVRPDHLFLGTKSSNNSDRHAKNRDAKGSRNGKSVLNDGIVREIKRLYQRRSFGARKIAVKLGLNYSTVNNVTAGRVWK